MRVIVLGYDKLAALIVSSLLQEGHTITVLDHSRERLDLLPRDSRLEAALSSGSLMEDLRQLGMTGVDAFLAISEDDCTNAMAAQAAGHIFHVSEVVCRLEDPARETFYRDLGLSVVSSTPNLIHSVREAVAARR